MHKSFPLNSIDKIQTIDPIHQNYEKLYDENPSNERNPFQQTIIQYKTLENV